MAFSFEVQKFFSITRTIFSHSRSEQFWLQKENINKNFFNRLYALSSNGFLVNNPLINYPVEEVVDDEGSELQLSSASELSEKSEVESRISQESMDDHEVSDQESDVVEIASESEPDEPMVGVETTIAMTPSSRKSMVAQFFENDEAEESQVKSSFSEKATKI